ncbi:MAG: DUF6636 domain-containing protein [Verrucomicrobiota bacterium]
MVRAAVVFAVALLLAGGGSALGAGGADTFRTPSGNIRCAYEHYGFAPIDLRCDILTGIKPLPPRPKNCDLDWGVGYAMGQRGPARVLCAGDTVSSPTAPVLAYGTTRQFGVFRCTSTRAGLRCVNSTGNGFFLSTRHSYTFKEPAPRNGSFRTPSGNIVCGYGIAPDGSASMECGIRSGLKPPPKPIHCGAGDPNDKRVGLTETGPARPVLCAGDPGPLLPQVQATARVLGYSSTIRIGGITCSSATTGLTCRNRAGHGFFLSRQNWRTF